jgi:hypothetical protein
MLHWVDCHVIKVSTTFWICASVNNGRMLGNLFKPSVLPNGGMSVFG